MGGSTWGQLEAALGGCRLGLIRSGVSAGSIWGLCGGRVGIPPPGRTGAAAGWLASFVAARPRLRTCVSGQRCAVEALTGRGLSASDRLLILDTCGAALAIPRLGPVSALAPVGSSGGRYASAVALTAAGGVYRLCWCAGGGGAGGARSCSAAEAARVDGGALMLVGPSPVSQAPRAAPIWVVSCAMPSQRHIGGGGITWAHGMVPTHVAQACGNGKGMRVRRAYQLVGACRPHSRLLAGWVCIFT